jgi:hypothetical protein
MRADQLRTRSVRCKVTDGEYERLYAVASAEGMTLSKWMLKELLERAENRENHQATMVEQTLLAEMLALRTILLNLHFTVAKGESLTPEYMLEIIDRADASKVRKAVDRLCSVQKSEMHNAIPLGRARMKAAIP